jgi:repressor LexA
VTTTLTPAQVKKKLTDRQRLIFGFIGDATAEFGFPPSIREIGQAVGLASTSSVHAQLKALERKGFIRREPGGPRTIQILVKVRSRRRGQDQPAEKPEMLALKLVRSWPELPDESKGVVRALLQPLILLKTPVEMVCEQSESKELTEDDKDKLFEVLYGRDAA